MTPENFQITEFLRFGTFPDPAGHRLEMQGRHASSLLFTVKGWLRFTERDGRVHISDENHPLYLPRGACYLNECPEGAVSLMFTFQDNQTETAITALAPIPSTEVYRVYDKFERAQAEHSAAARFTALSLLYTLLAQTAPGTEAVHPLFRRAVSLLTEKLGDRELTVGGIAEKLFVSEVYLRKIFRLSAGVSPGAYLTELRMERAGMYLRENRSVTETAEAVGYADIYSFSRSFRRHFGVPPTAFARRGSGSQSSAAEPAPVKKIDVL